MKLRCFLGLHKYKKYNDSDGCFRRYCILCGYDRTPKYIRRRNMKIRKKYGLN